MLPPKQRKRVMPNRRKLSCFARSPRQTRHKSRQAGKAHSAQAPWVHALTGSRRSSQVMAGLRGGTPSPSPCPLPLGGGEGRVRGTVDGGCASEGEGLRRCSEAAKARGRF